MTDLPGLSIRVGQFTADSEFVISDYGALFTNGTFGWPAFLYTNIPAGGRAIRWALSASASPLIRGNG